MARGFRLLGSDRRGEGDRGSGIPRFSRHTVAGQSFLPEPDAFQIGYFTVNPDAGEGFVDWDWLGEQTPAEERDCVRHLQFEARLRW